MRCGGPGGEGCAAGGAASAAAAAAAAASRRSAVTAACCRRSPATMLSIRADSSSSRGVSASGSGVLRCPAGASE